VIQTSLRGLADAVLTDDIPQIDPQILLDAASYIDELTVTLDNLRSTIAYLETVAKY
jgi:hypothetical protein